MATSRKPFTTVDLPILTRLFSEADLKFVDVGGRGGAFLALKTFARFARYYVFEPEAAEATRLQELVRRQWRDVTVMSDAVGLARGTASLYQTRNPGMSSLLEPDPAIAQKICLAGKFEVESVVEVPVVSLDEAADRHGFQDATFLKIDTQGTELDILQSGPRVVQSLVAVHLEASFHPFYKEQPLFADLDTYLRQRGFTLFSLSRTMLRRRGFQKTMYSTRMVTWAHCLYLREPDTLVDRDQDTRRRQFARLLAAALGFHQYDLGLEVAVMLGRAQLLDSRDVEQLTDEIQRFAAGARDNAMARMQKRNLQEDLMDASFRDKTMLE